MKSILAKARDEEYAVAAPNVWDLYSVKVAIEAAEEEKAPIILDFADFMGNIYEFGKIAKDLSINASIPVAINLDHGKTFEEAVRAIRAGFTSVMVDCSLLPFDQNVAQVKEIVKIAHAVGVSVEAELGHVGEGQKYNEERDKGLTDPEEAKEFIEETGIDCLAVAIGTAHGVYKGEPHIDFNRLEEIKKRVDIPLVLHGGSGTGDEVLKNIVKKGISKVNIFTDLSINGCNELKKYLMDDENVNLWEACKKAFEGYKQKLKHYIELFNSNAKA
jgi:fructose-bisphosphate aldolase class II